MNKTSEEITKEDNMIRNKLLMTKYVIRHNDKIDIELADVKETYINKYFTDTNPHDNYVDDVSEAKFFDSKEEAFRDIEESVQEGFENVFKVTFEIRSIEVVQKCETNKRIFG